MAVRASRIAFQGVAGAFSHEACRAVLPDAEPVAMASFADVFAAVTRGDCDLAFVPVENSTAGPVPEVVALLADTPLRVVGEHLWPIRLQLMALPGRRIEDVEAVASHPMALKQCRRLLDARGWRAVEAFDTAGAAAALAADPAPGRAVVAPRAAAELYGLDILLADVQDSDDNTTRFLCLERPEP